MPRWAILMAIMCFGVLRSTGECPGTCECKWKSGKESVLCDGRNLTGVPQHLDSGTQLLDLSRNNLTTIREEEFSTAQLINLQKVFLSKCGIRTLHRKAFRNLFNLVDLDLSFNLLSTVPSHTFEFIPLLTELKLNGNPIVALMNNSFKSVPHLNKLDLSECRISYIELNAFARLDISLEWLKLDKNRMTNIRGDSLMVLGNLKGLELAGNPWNCSCGLRPLREWVLRHNIPQTISPECRYPDRVTGRLWDKLDLDDFACLPRVVAFGLDHTSQEGDNITLRCAIRSIPLPTVRWLKREKIIANLSGLHAGTSHLFTIQVSKSGSNLTITSAELGDSGEYTCRAENKAGKTEARVNLAISVKPEEPTWSTRVVIATAAVIILFSLAAVLLLICLCCLWKRQRFHTRAAVALGDDAYEMNRKPANNYDKVIRYGADTKFDNAPGHPRNGYIGATNTTNTDSEQQQDTNKVGLEILNGRSWATMKKTSPIAETSDLHIPRLKEIRYDECSRRNSLLSPASELLPVKSHSIRDNSRVPTLFPSFSDPDNNYPDLLETDKNTLPRRGYRQRRTRTGSCGSESLSPLLQGSSDESCDSAPLPLLNIPDPYPELDKFLKEYRNLQEQLYKMKESCENLKQDNLRFKSETASQQQQQQPQTISRLMDDVYKTAEVEPMYSVYGSTTAVESLYNGPQHLLNDSLGNVILSTTADNNNPRHHEDKGDSFWLTRRTMISNFTESAANQTKSYYDS